MMPNDTLETPADVHDNLSWRLQFTCGLFLLAFGLPAEAEPLTIDDPTVTNRDRFGRSVEIHENHILVGALHDDTFGESSGQAHLFDTEGNLIRTFNSPSPEPGDLFGRIVSFDGNRALVGASGVPLNGMDRVGRAFLFDMTTGNLLHTFNDPLPTSGGQFGWGAAIDGNNVLISARQNDTDGNNVGKAYLFDAVSGELLHTFSDPTPTDRDDFGHFAAIDRNYVIVGAPLDDTKGTDVGQAYLFDVLSGELLHTFDNPSIAEGDHFGHSVWVDEDNILIGAWGDDTHGTDVGQAYLFTPRGELMQTYNDPTPTTKDEFSRELAMQGDHVLIGARLDDSFGEDVGQVHLFDRISGDLLETFDDPTVTVEGEFGRSVALDENRFVVGDYKDDTLGFQVGQVHVFTYPEVLGDFDSDGVLDIDDINKLSEESAGGLYDGVFDLNDDGSVDEKDIRIWIHDLRNSFFGDSNLDGEFSSGDLVSVFKSGEYEDDVAGNSSWETGDWNGDGEFGTSDLVLAFQDDGFEVGPRPMAVPESTSPVWATCMSLCLLIFFTYKTR